jgi:tetratricopeptide (TPR) repeat protein
MHIKAAFADKLQIKPIACLKSMSLPNKSYSIAENFIVSALFDFCIINKGRFLMKAQTLVYRIPCLLLLTFTLGCNAYYSKNHAIGDYQLSQENYEEAIERFEQDISETPDNWRVREKLGYAYFKTDQYDKAISEFREVLKDDPTRPYATYYLGLAYLKNENRSEAIKTFKSYSNPREPLVEHQIKKQLLILEMVESMKLAKAAVQQEKSLETIQPREETVAVFYFKDLSPDHRFRHLQKAIATMIITDLSQVESLHVLERMRIQYLLTEMKMGQTGIVEKKTAPKTGRLLGAESLIVGSFNSGSFRVNTNVASTTENQLKGSIAVHSEVDEFYIVQKELVYKILEVLEVELTPEEKAKFSKYHTKNLNAVIYFGQGLEALDKNEWKEAKEYFNRAVEEDPSFKLAMKYRDACPAAGTPSVSAMGAMSGTGLADTFGEEVENAMDSVVDINDPAPGITNEESGPVSNTGSISISW